MRVLLVEDDPMIAQAVKGALADEMYTVEHVANGRDALMMLSVNEYGFVLLDLGLPGLDGMTVLRTLRENAEGSKSPVSNAATAKYGMIPSLKINISAAKGTPPEKARIVSMIKVKIAPLFFIARRKGINKALANNPAATHRKKRTVSFI